MTIKSWKALYFKETLFYEKVEEYHSTYMLYWVQINEWFREIREGGLK